MTSIDDKFLEKVKLLYLKRGFSAREIGESLNVSLDAVYYFLRQHCIPRRSASEQNNLRFSRKNPSFRIKKRLSVIEKELMIAGVFLYWCEGSTWQGENIVDFANSNPKMIFIFLKFLREICGINENKLRVYLYCYENHDPRKLLKYWSSLTGISKRQFTKPYIRRDFRPEKRGKMLYGMVHIRYADKKLLLLLRDWIEKLQNRFWMGGGAVKRTSL